MPAPTERHAPLVTEAQKVDKTAKDEAAKVFAAAMPKEEIGALRFLQDNPELDGRDVVVAIFDTGVDPGAQGLQVTTTGKPKILAVIDCTGSGDVVTSTKVKADAEGCIQGTGGRKMKVNPEWENPSGEWRVGCTRLYELLPGGLAKRCKAQRARQTVQAHRAAVSAATKALADFQAAHPSSAGTLCDEDQLQADELKARLQLLKDVDDKFEDDPGPMLQAVAWHDGKTWRVALDTSDIYVKPEDQGKGLLADATPLTDFHLEQQYGTFSPYDACNYGINVYDEGDVVSIVVDAGAHGTHVAGITAAYHPDAPELNGIAPGAQIISCKIGDTRLGSMETGVGLTRALIAVLQHKADVINMSYGEATTTPNLGRFVDLANEIVHKHGVVFVSSAGNAGPALSTVGAPGGAAGAIIGVGAYVSPSLAAVGHSVRSEAGGANYTWSSRGPTLDGHPGVCLSAPGGALAPVPQWCQQGRQLMNGTSMSSPNAAGGVALLVSALKAHGHKFSPTRLRRALENTCMPLGEGQADAVLTYGRGMMQVDKAWDYLQRSREVDEPDVRYELSVQPKGCSGQATKQRGVYLRHRPTGNAATYTVTVNPTLHVDADVKTELLAVEDKLQLLCSADWVKAPQWLLLPAGGRSFEVEVDVRGLASGLHYAEVQAINVEAPWRGPLFRVPIAVALPQPVGITGAPHLASIWQDAQTPGHNNGTTAVGTLSTAAEHAQSNHDAPELAVECAVDLGNLEFVPGEELRYFLDVPEGATWAELRVKAGALSEPLGLMVRMTQILPTTRYSSTEKRAYLQLASHDSRTLTLAVTPGTALEVTLAQLWSSLGKGLLQAQVSYHGVECSPSCISAAAGTGVVQAVIRAPLRAQQVKPVAKLTHLQIPLAVSDSVLAPLNSDRDALTDGRLIHSLLLTYMFECKEEGDYTPRLPLLNGYVYDAVLEAQMLMVFDANKQRLKVMDIYPEEVKLKKGSYTFRLWLRHDNVALLQSLQNMTLVLERKLSTAVSLPVSCTQACAVLGLDAVKEMTLMKGQRVSLFVGPLPDKGLPSDAAPGRVLTGSLTLGKSSDNGTGGAPVPLTWGVPPKLEAKDKSGDAAAKDKDSAATKLENAIRDAKLSILKELKWLTEETAAASEPGTAAGSASTAKDERASDSTAAPGERDTVDEKGAAAAADDEEQRKLYWQLREELEQQHPKHLPLLQERLTRLSKLEAAARQTALQDIVTAADAVIAAVDSSAVAVALASKSSGEDSKAATEQKEIEKQRDALVDALEKKCWALLDMENGASAGADDDFTAAFLDLRKWVDTLSGQYALLHAHRERRRSRPAVAIQALSKLLAPEDKPPTMKALELKAQLLEQLQWQHLHTIQLSQLKQAFPSAYPPF